MSRDNGELFPTIPGYQVTGRLGSGSTGVVYLADQMSTGRQVAVKALAPWLLATFGFRDRFREEAQLMARFDDANLVSIYGYVEHGDGAFLIMQYVSGSSLRVLMADGGRITPEQALGVLSGALSGLAAAHRLGVVHGDLKPENVIVAADGVSKLVDFGQASPSGSRPSGGTPAYASPEAVRDEPVDARSDVYAAGLILYELLAGRAPFEGTASEVAAAQRDRVPDRLRDVPLSVADLVARSLSKSPDDRPENAEEFLAALQDAATASYGPDWRLRASLAALAGALVGGAAAATVATSPASASASAAPASTAKGLRGARRLVSRLHQSVTAHPVSAAASVVLVAGALTAVSVIGGSAAVAGPFSALAASGGPAQVVCADASHCWVNLESSVLAFGPSGQRIDSQLPVQLQTVADVACPSDSYCLAVGSGSSGSGVAATSSDGGATWKAANLPSTVAAFTFASCATGTTDCFATSRSGLYRSTGPGQWTPVKTPDGTGPMSLLSCPTATTCVAMAGGDAETTHDAGATWTTVGLPGVLYTAASVDCIDSETCWVVGEYTNSLQSQIGTINRTTDGGAIWTRVPFPASPQPYAFDSVSCSGPSSCLVDGTVEWGGLESSSGSPYFLSTADGGATWSVHLAPETMPFVPNIDCVNPTTCWLSGQSGVGKTVDGGSTWTVDWYGSKFDISSLSCPASVDCYVGGAFPDLIRNHLGAFITPTANSMAVLVELGPTGSYTKIDASDPNLSGLSGLSCTASECVGIGSTVTGTKPSVVSIAMTSGRVVALPLPAGIQSLSGVACPSAGACLLTGQAAGQPTLVRQSSSGWTEISLPYGTQSVGDVSCPNASRCFLLAIADGVPQLLSVNFGGSGSPNWRRASLPSDTQSLTALSCPGTDVCWVGAELQPPGAATRTPVILRALHVNVWPQALSTASTTSPSTTSTTSTTVAGAAPYSAGWMSEPIPSGVTGVTTIDCASAATCFAEATLTNGDQVLLGAGRTGPVTTGEVAPPSTT
jgi:photosystem II stability/assembly factor-like uncharacterized protein/predicted Ser/Thr protein kinase